MTQQSSSNNEECTILPEPVDLSDELLWDDLIVPLYFRQHIQRSLMRRIANDKFPLDYGYIIFGPPGTGKTTIVKAIAKQLNWKCIYVTPQNFIKPKLSIEEAMKLCFEQVKVRVNELVKENKENNVITWKKKKDDGNPPANIVLIFDEIDELVVTREEGNDRQTRLATTMMLPIMQNLRKEAEKNGFVFFVLTNHIERFDPAITRTGRFDLLLPLGPPDRQARYLLFKKFIRKLADEYRRDYNLEIRTSYDIELRKRPQAPNNQSSEEEEDLYTVTTADLDIISRASARLTLEDILTICTRVVDQGLAMQPSLLENDGSSKPRYLDLYTRYFIDWIYKFRHVEDNKKHIEKFYKDFDIYSRGSTLYPKANTLQEKVEHEFNSLRINHNLSELGITWKANEEKILKFSYINIAGLSPFLGQISVEAVLANNVIASAKGDENEPLSPGVESREYELPIKPQTSGRMKIRFLIDGKFELLGIEEVLDKNSAYLSGKLVHTREITVV